MTIRSAIRLERAKLTKQEQAAEERLAAIRGKIEALDAAEAALAGETPSANGDKPKRTRTFKGRKSREERKNETLDALREVEPRLLADEGRSARATSPPISGFPTPRRRTRSSSYSTRGRSGRSARRVGGIRSSGTSRRASVPARR